MTRLCTSVGGSQRGHSSLESLAGGSLALTAVALLLALEVVDEQEIDFLELGLEVVEISLIVAASLATMMLFGRVEDQERTQQQMRA